MKVLLVLSTAFAFSFGELISKNHNRIINGREATIEEHPYQVSLHVNGNHDCGGSIINKDTIVSAAHCVKGSDHNLITIRVGSTYKTQGEEHQVLKIFQHKSYNTVSIHSNDIAILKLSKPLTFTTKVQPIKLQPAGTPVPAGTSATVSGWGNMNVTHPKAPDGLRAVEMDVISNEECQRLYENMEIVTDDMLCALTPNQGACFGDSGGPLVADGALIGVVSGGYECGGSFYPTVYANVSALHDFVDQYL